MKKVKAAIDFLLALILILVLQPLLLLLLLAVFFLLGESPIFRQVRIGKNRRPFILYKIKTISNRHARCSNGFLRDLRRLHIDEMLQLLNVILGHMSLVGPRPHIPEHVEQYEPWQLKRLSVKPGIVGLRQLRSAFRQLQFNQKLEDDIEYIETWSLKGDFKIIYQSVIMFLKRLLITNKAKACKEN